MLAAARRAESGLDVLVLEEHARVGQPTHCTGIVSLETTELAKIPEGKEVTITIIDVPSEADVDAFRRSFGGWKGTFDADALLRNIRESRQASTRPEPRL